MIPLQQSFQKDILLKVTFLSDFHVVILHWLLDDSIGFMIPPLSTPVAARAVIYRCLNFIHTKLFQPEQP